jgi:hypothetical protein
MFSRNNFCFFCLNQKVVHYLQRYWESGSNIERRCAVCEYILVLNGIHHVWAAASISVVCRLKAKMDPII